MSTSTNAEPNLTFEAVILRSIKMFLLVATFSCSSRAAPHFFCDRLNFSVLCGNKNYHFLPVCHLKHQLSSCIFVELMQNCSQVPLSSLTHLLVITSLRTSVTPPHVPLSTVIFSIPTPHHWGGGVFYWPVCLAQFTSRVLFKTTYTSHEFCTDKE